MRILIETQRSEHLTSTGITYVTYAIFFNRLGIGFANRLPQVSGVGRYIFAGEKHSAYIMRFFHLMISYHG